MTSIPIERLSTGSVLTILDPAWGRTAYLVEDIEFDGCGYTVTYGDDRGWNDTTYVVAGGSVDADGNQRSDSEISFEEWEALNEQALARLDASMADLARPLDAPVNLLDAVRAAGLREASEHQMAAE